VFPGNFINNRQPEKADETGNTYIAETITDNIEVPTENQAFTTTETRRARKSVGKCMRQALTTGN